MCSDGLTNMIEDEEIKRSCSDREILLRKQKN